MITRYDGKSYIGITVNPNNRFKQHLKSARFENNIIDKKILAECATYEKAEYLEEIYIDLFDTWNNGLNLTATGKGLNDGAKFNTLGHKFDLTTRAKMSQAAMGRKTWLSDWNKDMSPYSEETKQKWSQIRKNKVWSPRKITQIQAKSLYEDFLTFKLDEIDLTPFVKKTQRDKIHTYDLNELRTGGGQLLSKVAIFAKLNCKRFGVTEQCIKRIITRKGLMCPSYDET